MGAACCVATRPQKSSLHNDGPLAASPETLLSLWDDNSQGEDVTSPTNCTEVQRTLSLNGRGSRVASLSHTSHRQSLSGNTSVYSSPSDSSHAPQWPNSPILLAHNGNSITASSDLIVSSQLSETSSIEGCSTSGPSLNSYIPESFAPSLNTLDYLSRQSKSHPNRPGWFKSQPSLRRPSIRSRSFFYRHVQHACNNDLAGEFSPIQIHELDSSNSSSKPTSDGRHSSMMAVSSGNSTRASRSVSDWWSMQTFSDLVASSRRDGFRWSDAEGPPDMGWVTGRESMDGDSLAVERIKVNNSQAASPASHVQVHICGICSHNLPYNSETMAYSNNLSVVAVLFCGHVYHAECLEQITPEASQHDPSCPICVRREDLVSEHLAYPEERVIRSKGGFFKAFRSKSQSSSRNKTSRRVANDDIVGPEFFSGEILLSANDQLSSDNVFKLTSNTIEKHPLNKRLFTRHFSLKGKSRKEHGPNDTACNLPITLRDSGESSRASDLSLLHAKKGSSNSFRYFKKWVQD